MTRRAKAERRRLIRYFGVGFAALLISSHLAIAQNEDAKLLDEIEGAPKLNLQRAEFRFEPALASTSTEVLRMVSCVAVDRRGYVFVIQRGVPNPIIVADPAGKVVASWGENLFKIPHTIRVDPEGNVWAVDAESSTVYKFTPEGRQLLQINVGGQPTIAPPRRNPTGGGPPLVGQFVGTTDIAFGRNGQIYVSDGYANNRILEYGADGTKVREWGTKGLAPGEFDLPHAIAVATNGDLYIADRENGRVQRFTPDGRYLGMWKYGGRLFSLAFGMQEDLYLTVRSKLSPANADGWLVRVDKSTGRILGRIEAPVHLISSAPNGAIFIGTNNGGVLVFKTAT